MHNIIALNRQGLAAYIASDDYRNDDYVAITPHRAQSQMCNPLVNDEDILLLLIRENGKLLAYLGMMPGAVTYSSGESERITWLTCLWVAEAGRGHRLSETLIEHAATLCDNKMLLGDYVPFTKKIYDRTDLFIDEIYAKLGLRWYIKSDLVSLLGPKHPMFLKFSWLLNVVDFGLNILLTLRQKVIKKPIINYEEIATLGNEEAEFITKNSGNYVFHRNAEEINWMIANPWVACSNPEGDEFRSRYYFSSSDQDFRSKVYVARNEVGKIRAIAIFTIRNGSLKLPYFYYDKDITDISKMIEHVILKLNIKTFTTYDEFLAQSLIKSKSWIPIVSKQIRRNYRLGKYFSDKLNIEAKNLMQDGEGDCGFT